MERHHENSHRIISFATLISRTLLFLFFYLARSCVEKRIWPCLQSLYLNDWFSVICMVSTILILTLFDIMAMIVPFINVAKGVVYVILLVAGVYPTLWVLDTSLLIVHALVWLWCSQILPLLGNTAADAQRATRGVANAYEAEGAHLQRIRERFGEHAYLDAEMLDLNRQMLENQARQAEAMRYRQTREETTGVGSSLKNGHLMKELVII